MNNLEELIQKQSQTLGTIDRALSNFKKLGQAKKTAATTQNRMALLKEAYQLSQDLDAKIAACTDPKSRASIPYFAENQFEKAEERYQETLDSMAEVLAKAAPPPESSSNNGNSSNTMTSQPTVHLPRIQLPTFEGAFEEWESFRDRFTAMVINNNSLSNVERLHFLYSLLTGEASRAVAHLPVTENNFDIAWKTITSRYENKYRLISTHLNTLFSLPSVSSETPHELRSLRDKMNMSIQMLRNLNRPVDTWNDMLVFLGVQKLDRASRKAWEFQLSDSTEFPTYNEFDIFVKKRIRALEALPTIKREKPIEAEKIKPYKQKAIIAHSTTSMKITCPVCQQNHLIYQCTAFLSKSIAERFNFIKQHKRCVNCFSTKHSTPQCNSPRSCKECHQRHNSLLHFPTKPDTAPSASGKGSTDPDPGTEISANIASDTPTNCSILLSTARVLIHSNQGRCLLIRALVDQGSVGTLVTEHLAQSLRLHRTKQPNQITGIGGKIVHQLCRRNNSIASRLKRTCILYDCNHYAFFNQVRSLPKRGSD
ncbi:uncharacterized protein LOC105664176 [Megachile rotundata]|uniref:uncharacterized protein LOC105664176 n=1 Tax=Megachile rotundata TaxID=143995 RepID=UPI003FD6AA70